MDAIDTVENAVLASLAAAPTASAHDLPVTHYRLAVSGGLDSMVLLHVMAGLRAQLGRSALTCYYVNHGLHPEAPEWGTVVARAAEDLGVPFVALDAGRIDSADGGLEAAARKARYAVLATAMEEGDVLLTAHHQDDQAETVLLQLLRGAGVAGLRAMPASGRFGPGTHRRPLLALSRETLAAYAKARELVWIDDPSNSEQKHDRNYLRQSVLPLLRARWPAVAGTLAQLAATCADEQQVLDGAAVVDLAAAVADDSSLAAEAVRSLPPASARNGLRWWLRQQGFAAPPRARLEALLTDLLPARADAQPCVRWQGCEVRRYQDRLYAMAPLAPSPDGSVSLPFPSTTNASLTLPDRSVLSVERQRGRGIAEHWLRSHDVRIGWRRGGEKLVLPGRTHTSSLKKVLQARGVLPWMRERVPLVLIDGQVAGVAGVLVAGPFAAEHDAPGYTVSWQAGTPICASPARS
ncbi:MAG: tRNA lysidine(34) synthetase TilS [Pseudomonadota bacterium]